MRFFKTIYFHTILILLIIVAQSFYPVSPVTLALPDFILITFFFIAINWGWEKAYILGFCCGLFLDFFTPATALGLNAFLYTIIGFAAGKLKDKLFFGKFIFPLSSILVLTLIKYAMISLIYLIFRKSSEIAELDGIKFLIELAFNIGFAIPIYFILSFTRVIDLNNKDSIL
ncbi:MAG: rod shape-determining protein MreD [Spirochaetales bacterium]|nr:rod shape-determining protein MreD [Spirochaetales bacterium]